MKSKHSFWICLIFLVSPHSFLYAQSDSADAHKLQLKISMNYSSSLNYYGRIESIKSAAFMPGIEVWFNPQLFINASPIFVYSKSGPLSYIGTVASIGYEKATDKWITNINLLKPFYTATSTLPQTVLKAQAGINFTRLNKIVNVTFGGDTRLSDKVDFGATAGLDHIFSIINNDGSSIIIDPSIFTYAGTQRFSGTYAKRKRSILGIPLSNQQETKSVNQFKILAYEALCSVIFSKHKFMLLATPSFIIPQNLLQIPGEPELSEKGENTFYITAAIKYSF